MTQQISVSVSDVQMKALEYQAVCVQTWADNAVHEMARIASIDIVNRLVEHCNANEIQMAVGQDAQVLQAFELGIVQAAADQETS